MVLPTIRKTNGKQGKTWRETDVKGADLGIANLVYPFLESDSTGSVAPWERQHRCFVVAWGSASHKGINARKKVLVAERRDASYDLKR